MSITAEILNCEYSQYTASYYVNSVFEIQLILLF